MLIKVGDKFNFEEDEWTVVNVTGCDNTLIARTKDGDVGTFFENTVYQYMYEQQKQRADRAEKRWSELKKRLIENCKSDRTVAKQYSRAFLCLLDELEGKENVFETVQQLEEDGE